MVGLATNRSQGKRPGIDDPIPGRILFVASTRHEGGVERVSARLAAELHRADIRVECLFACRPGSFTAEACEREGVPVLPYVAKNSGDLVAVLRLARLIAQTQPTVVHVHSRRDYLPTTLAVILARRMGATARLFFHCHLVRALGEPPAWSGRFFGRHVDRFLAVSESVRSDLLTRHPALSRDQVVILSNGVDFSRFDHASEEQGQQVREHWGIPADAFVIGMVGRLDAKGQKYVVDLAPALSKALPGGFRLLFVGGEGPAGYEKELRQLARDRGVESQMVLAGVQEEVGPYLAAMDIFAHLPEDEAFGLAIAEAMAARLPVVASTNPACREILVDGETGHVVDVADKEGMLRAFTALAGDTALRSRMGSAGYARAHENYSLESQIARLIGLYGEAAIK